MNIGLIGFGSMGKTHAYAVHNLNYFFGDGISARIAGVCTAHRETSEKAAREYGFDVSVTDEDELIYSPDIDIIDICTPNILHFETAKKAVLAGKHVYCEKPLAVTPEQADMLASLAAEKGVTAQVVFNNRFMSGVMRAKEIISGGLIGNVISFRCEYLHSSCTDLSRNAGWKQDRDICGGGVLFDLGSHAIDLIRYLCGEFSSVSGKAQIAHPLRRGIEGREWRTNADEAFYLTAELECGAVGTIEANKLAFGTNDDLSFEIYGDAGAVRFSLMQPNYIGFYDGRKPGTLRDFPGSEGADRLAHGSCRFDARVSFLRPRRKTCRTVICRRCRGSAYHGMCAKVSRKPRARGEDQLMMPTAAAKSGGDSEGAMLTVGLTGSTGSGKGYVSEIFVKSGIPCLDTDRVCRDVYMKGQPCYNDLVAAFGAGILREDGEIDRKALSDLAFPDDDKYRMLNSIAFLHIRKATEKWLDERRAEGARIAVIDAPMLYESGFDRLCDKVVSVIADRPTQIARVMQRDGITAETAKLRLSKQKPDSYYRSRCDYVLDNSASNAGDIWNDTRRLIGVLRRLPAARC